MTVSIVKDLVACNMTPVIASPGKETMPDSEALITIERGQHLLLIGLNRAQKCNAFNLEMLAELSLAYAQLENDDELRAGVLFAHGDHFTAGLDFADVGPSFASGKARTRPAGATPGALTAPGASPSSSRFTAGC